MAAVAALTSLFHAQETHTTSFHVYHAVLLQPPPPKVILMHTPFLEDLIDTTPPEHAY